MWYGYPRYFWCILPGTNALQLTLTGLCFIVVQYFLVQSYCPDMVCPNAPSWVWFAACACFFIYQTLDAIDGKQARRTGSSSCCGELVDHCCDAFSLSSMFITVNSAMQAGSGPVVTTMFLFAVAQFYCTHYNTYYRHMMVLNSFSGPTEAQVLSMSMILITGIFGGSIWLTPFFDVLPATLQSALLAQSPTLVAAMQSISIAEAELLAAMVLSAFTLLQLIRDVRLHVRNQLKFLGSLINLLPLLINLSVFLYFMEVTVVHSEAAYLRRCIFTIGGWANAHSATEIVVAHMAQRPSINITRFWSAFYVAGLWMLHVSGQVQVEVLLHYGVWTLIVLSVMWFALICHEIDNHFHIPFFTIQKKKQKQQ